MQQPKMSFADTPWVKCECGGHVFTPALMFKKVSALLTPSGKEEQIPIEVMICEKCKKIPEFMHAKYPGIPDDMKAVKPILS